MHLEGSCHCRSVRFSVDADAPVPFTRCYCCICRKTAGAGGFAISAWLPDKDGRGRHQSSARRYFCARCGSALWLWDPTWPDLVHPHASAIDTPLPAPPAHVHCMVGSKADWVEMEGRAQDPRFDAYPDQSLAEWHRAHGF